MSDDTPPTAEELVEWERLCAAAKRGEFQRTIEPVLHFNRVCHAAMPRLLAEVRRLRVYKEIAEDVLGTACVGKHPLAVGRLGDGGEAGRGVRK